MTPAKIDGTKEAPEEAEMEVSPFVELLIARMKSHPKEFYHWDPSRMGATTFTNTNKSPAGGLVETTKGLWNRKEKRLYNQALREVRLQEAHERLMSYLLK